MNQALDLIQSEIEAGQVRLPLRQARAQRRRKAPSPFSSSWPIRWLEARLDDVMPLALALELIHTATLVHDDINDEAQQRAAYPPSTHKPGRPRR